MDLIESTVKSIRSLAKERRDRYVGGNDLSIVLCIN